MSKLTGKERREMPAKEFAGPDRSYPINDMGHAESALGRVGEFGTESLKAKVRAKVHRKFPGLAEHED